MPAGKDYVEILYALSDEKGNYSKVAGTSLCSLLENAGNAVRVHLFHDGSIAGKNRQRFEEMVRRYGQELVFYNVRDLLPEVWQEAEVIYPQVFRDERFTEATLYRLLAPQILPKEMERLIYLDADTIVNLDICELWKEPLNEGGMGAVREADMLAWYGLRGRGEALDIASRRMEVRGVNLDTYFNAGVLLMDLGSLRKQSENLLLSGLSVLAEHSEEKTFYDQSILNYYFAAKLTPLPRRYNILIDWDKKYGKTELVQGIYHYLGYHLGMDKQEPRDVLYFKYFLKTPWCNAEFFCHFFDSFTGMMMAYYRPRAVNQAALLRQLAAVLARKTLVLAAAEEWEPKVREWLMSPKSLLVQENLSDKQAPFPEGVRFCSLGKGAKLQLKFDYDFGTHFYLLFVSDYPQVNSLLSSAGLAEGEDYLDGSALVDSESWRDLEIRPQIFFERL